MDNQKYIDEHCDANESQGKNEDYEVCGECGENLIVCPECGNNYCPYCDEGATKENCGGCNQMDDDYRQLPFDPMDYKDYQDE